MSQEEEESILIDLEKSRFPYCIVWTPLPFITWLIPIIGHMGIATSNGVIRDFAGPYFVSEDQMAFGRPTKYWKMDPSYVLDGKKGWDEAILKASNIYCNRMHNLIWDNCHSHVSMALNIMKYQDKSSYNMVKTFFLFTYHCRYISFYGFLKTWLPFCIIMSIVIGLILYTKL
ncbi:hypothetical protein RDWZM_005186 [Blomia tropicalis]|uniref:Transmembrane protein 222 n=1 Tax=Blomia tropicalis TaxID=40697 RepID=A0A9Q0M5T7_BLOTA|nr:hypothetical protein RDWZM_005186 [Blomia tropicalis]